MAAINFGNGPNTSSGDTVKQALEKLQARIDALQGAIPPADTTPDAFSFADAPNVALGSTQASDWRQITGINAPAAASVTGGQWQSAEDNSGTNATALTASNGTVAPNKWVRVQHIASNSNGTATNTTLTIGGVSDTFTSTTVAGAATLDPALSAPILTADPTSPANGSSPKFFIDSPDDTLDISLGYKVVVRWRDKDGNLLGTGESAALTAAPNGSDLVISGLAALPAGTRRYSTRYERTNGSSHSAWSPDFAVGPDDVAPLLSAPTKADIGATGATLGFTTNEAGPRYTVAVPPGEATPLNTQVKAGQRASGTAAPLTFTGTATVGVNTYSASGFTAETAYKVVTVVEDALGNLSEPLVDLLTTAAGSTSVAKLATVTGVNKSQYVDVAPDGLSFTLNNDPGGQSWVRSTTALPPKAHFEATITGVELFWIGVSDASLALGPALYPVPGNGALAGFSLRINGTEEFLYCNGALLGERYSQPTLAAGRTYSFDVDTAAKTVVIKRHIGGTAVTVFSVTLTSNIPTTWTAQIGANNRPGAGTVNFGASAFLMTPEAGHTGF